LHQIGERNMPTIGKYHHDLVYIEYGKQKDKTILFIKNELTIIPAGTRNAKTLISMKYEGQVGG